MFIFNEKHHFVAGSKNYKEDKPAVQMAQAPHCKSVVYGELVEEARSPCKSWIVGMLASTRLAEPRNLSRHSEQMQPQIFPA